MMKFDVWEGLTGGWGEGGTSFVGRGHLPHISNVREMYNNPQGVFLAKAISYTFETN